MQYNKIEQKNIRTKTLRINFINTEKIIIIFHA